MNTTTRRTGCSAGLLLVALCALAPLASAGARWPVQPAPVGAVARTTTVATVQCPCNPDLPRPTAVAGRPAPCPCNTGLPDGPSGALAVGPGNRQVDAGAVAARPSPVVPAGEAFDWADAGVGAGIAVLVGALVIGGIAVVGRRRWHTEAVSGIRR